MPQRPDPAESAQPSRPSRRPRAVTGRPVVYGFLWALLLLTTGLAAASPAVAQATQQARSEQRLPLTARSDTVDLLGIEQAFRNVARTVSSSVVAITASQDPAPAHTSLRSSELTASGVEHLLAGGPRIVGTGFCIDESGYILTNEHVVGSARQIYVTTDDGRVFPAMVVGSDPRSDLAVLKIPGRLPAVEFARPNSVRRGQWTIALGNPVGLSGRGEMSMSVGVVSAIGRDLPRLSAKEGRIYSNLIQTTAEVNPGNSGGPLFDLHGRVLGVVTAVVLPHKSTNGLGFAMPADETMQQKIEQLKRGRPVVYGYLGVAVRDVAGGGVRVTTVGDHTPAASVLRDNDVILRIDGRFVRDHETFVRLIGASAVDRPITLVVLRDGRELAMSVRLEARTDAISGVHLHNQRLHWRGVTLGTAEGQNVRVIEVDPQSPLAREGLRPGSVIRDVAGQIVSDLITLQRILDETPAELSNLGIVEDDSRVAQHASISP